MWDVVSCLRYLFALGWRLDRRRLAVGGGLLLLGAAAAPVVAIGAGHLVDQVASGGTDAARWAVIAALALTGELMLGHFAHLYYFELAELTEEWFNQKLLRMVNGTDELGHADSPAFADRIDLLRQDILQMRMTVQSELQLGAIVMQTALTTVVLAMISAWLLLLPTVAILPVLMGRRAEQVLQATREAQAPATRAIRHLRRLAASPAAQKEIRLCGGDNYLVERQQALLDGYASAMARAHLRYSLLRGVGQVAFALAYVAAVFWVFLLARRGSVSVGDVVLVVTLATQFSVQMATGLELLGIVHRAAAGLRRFLALGQEVTQTTRPDPTGEVPRDAWDGIRLESVSFTYPGTEHEVLHEVNLYLPAGTSVALVGENGAGKSTLLKLLVGLYRPTRGQMLVNGVKLATVHPAAWRQRTAALFQDFARVELSLQHSVGIGRLSDVNSVGAVTAAMRRASAGAVLDHVGGVTALLGSGYGDGRELSGGQWQSVALARTLMRADPVLLTLDEPAAALDALAEQRLMDAYQAISAEVAATVGGVTVFVTHRMSTVRLADRIIVLAGGRVVEQGSHAELLFHGGRYAELYALQSRAYAS